MASQQNTENTVEEHILRALVKSNLIQDRKTCNYSLCGRTDKGVSAACNIISLLLRSKNGIIEDEYNYSKIINRQLPEDIRIISHKIVPHHFDARFSCLYREYRYFFIDDNFDFEKMKEACQFFVGVHDFKNFCKDDPGKKRSTIRRILTFEVHKNEANVGEFRIKGYSFLWHQVRCMVAVLFKIGAGVEEPSLIRHLLTNLEVKPHYEIACETGLVLYDCVFETIQFQHEDDVEENSTALASVFNQLMIRMQIVNCIFGKYTHLQSGNKTKYKKIKLTA